MLERNNFKALANAKNIEENLTECQKMQRYEWVNNILKGKIPQLQTKETEIYIENNIIYVKNCQITSVYPFSVFPTNKKVVFLNSVIEPVYAMCAVDALGIYHFLKEPIKIQTQCQESLEPIELILNEKNFYENKDYQNIRVLHTDLSLNEPWATCCCCDMQFFKNQNNLENWVATNGNKNKSYYSLSLKEANFVAKKIFSRS